jgi:hypothetical protein
MKIGGRIFYLVADSVLVGAVTAMSINKRLHPAPVEDLPRIQKTDTRI